MSVRSRSTNRSLQLGSQLLGNEMRVDAVANDLRADEDDQLRPRDRSVLMRKYIAKLRNLVEHRDAAAIELPDS